MRMQESRSVGVQVDLCNCSCRQTSSQSPDNKLNYPVPLSNQGKMSSQTETESTPLCRGNESSIRRLGSSEDRVASEDTVDRCPRPGIDPSETRRLLDRDEDDGKRRNQSFLTGSTSPTNPISGYPYETRRQASTTRTSSNDSMSHVKRDSASSHHQAYHIRRKLASFRSDSVFSDVMPTTSSSSIQDPRKGSDPCEKTVRGSGSLSSLKPKESKWVSLRKKLKINSSGSTSSSKKSLEQKDENGGAGDENPPPLKQVMEKRSLFQRAKTLSILPVGKLRSDSTEESRAEKHRQKKHQHQVQEPKELFNVGGEMNMIPLEFLININDLNIGSK